MAQALGRPCRICGADEWVRNGRQTFRCRPCQHRRHKRRQGRYGGLRRTMARHMARNARHRAERDGLVFDITIEDIVAAWPLDNKCPVFGFELVKGTRRMHDASPTLDRLVAWRGYLPDNIAVISNLANRLKSTGTALQFEQIAAWMRTHFLD